MEASGSRRARSYSMQWEDAVGKVIIQIDGIKTVKSCRGAVRFMKSNGGEFARPALHALYLLRVPESKGFTRRDVSIYLSGLDEDDEVVTNYFRLVHFDGKDILQSLRAYFTTLKLVQLMDGGQMNPLLYALANAFKANGGRFEGDEEDCVRIYNALLMLDNSLHNQSALGRSRMTEQRFMEFINDKNASEIPVFGEDEMRRLYRSVKEMPLAELYPIFSQTSGPSGSQIDQMLNNVLTQHRRKESRTDYLTSQLHQLYPEHNNDMVLDGDTTTGGDGDIGTIDMGVIASNLMSFIPTDDPETAAPTAMAGVMSLMNSQSTDDGISKPQARKSTDLGSMQQEVQKLNDRILELENTNREMAKEIEYLQNSKFKLAVESTKCIDQLRGMLLSYQTNLRY